MMSFKRLNTLLGWVTFAVSFLVYMLTLEPSVSLWDCGEFLSAAYKLQVVHPPGAPFFLLLGRIFSIFAPNPAIAAVFINAMSAAASAGCVMFTFWITTYLAQKMLGTGNDAEAGTGRNILIFGAGLTAAFSNTFLDTFWFSAVEAEVYALSSFFTAITFWAVLRWEQDADKPGGDRWLILIAYLTGLAIGTHLLNLLVIPAVAFVYYFRRYEVTRKGLIIAFLIALGVLGFIMKGIIPGTVWYLANMDKLFVNSLGMPFYSGVLFGIALLIAGLVYGIRYSIRAGKYLLNLAMLSVSFILLGYSTYTMVVLRSMANPAIDMNNPEDMFNLLSYINREQYGDRPLVYGPYFNAPPIETEEVGEKWYADSAEYKLAGAKYDYKFDERYTTLFPRMGKAKENDDIGYRYWGGMEKTQGMINALQNKAAQGGLSEEEQEQLRALRAQKPTFANNLRYFFSYQLYYMYMRYFMWNFVGRQNDQQAMLGNTQFDGNWLSGIAPIDYLNTGTQKNLPDDLKNNKARNTYFFLPLIIGIIGMSLQFKKRSKDAWVVMILFLFTGILINVYMNQPPFEPRERDYSVVGSFQTFCIWIGLGVLGIAEWLRKYLKNARSAAMAASAVALLAAPVLMASQNWDDHDRSARYLGIDYAKNYLQSCPPNAILFTNGDNDTYPLWYAQNVEGIRTDVRIINQSLLPTEWYSSVLLDKVYNSDPLPLTLTKNDLRAGRFEYGIRFQNLSLDGFDEAAGFTDGRKVVNFVLGKDPANMTKEEVFPTRKIRIPVDRKAILENGMVEAKDTGKIAPFIDFRMPGEYFSKGDLLMLDLIVTNAERGWKRPICFTTTSGYDFMGLNSWLQCEGLSFRLVPVNGGTVSEDRGRPANIAEQRTYDNLMKFRWGGMKEKKNFYLDDKAMMVPQALQQLVINMGDMYSNEISRMMSVKMSLDSGRQTLPAGTDVAAYKANLDKTAEEYRTKAVKLLDLIAAEIPEHVLTYRNEVRYYLAMLYMEFGEDKKGEQWMDKCMNNANQYARYFKQFNQRGNSTAAEQYQNAIGIMQTVQQLAKDRGKTALADKYQKVITQASRP